MTPLNRLVKIFLKIRDKKEMKNFLLGLFTQKELDELSMRTKIVGMLKRGVPQRTISEKLGGGIGTVTRGSNEIKRGRFISL